MDHDINKNLKSTIEAIKLNKNDSVIRLPEAGHYKPQEFNQIIEAFIKRESVKDF